jgi:hypothetical protein
VDVGLDIAEDRWVKPRVIGRRTPEAGDDCCVFVGIVEELLEKISFIHVG